MTFDEIMRILLYTICLSLCVFFPIDFCCYFLNWRTPLDKRVFFAMTEGIIIGLIFQAIWIFVWWILFTAFDGLNTENIWCFAGIVALIGKYIIAFVIDSIL